jgi:ABC-2 type transport system permease protein
LLYNISSVATDIGFSGKYREFMELLGNISTSWFNLWGGSVKIAFRENLGLSFLYSVGIILIFLGLAIVVWKLYKNFFQKGLEMSGAVGFRTRQGRNRKIPPFFAIFIKDFKQVVRISTYSFSYIAFAFATPIIIFLCAKFLSGATINQLGKSSVVVFSTALIMIFTTITNSFSASVVSREGNQFYLTKLMPINYKTQLIAKAMLNLVVSVGIAILSCAVLVAGKYITFPVSCAIFALSLTFSVATIFSGINTNVKKPILRLNEFGEISTKNIMAVMYKNISMIIILILSGWILYSSFGLLYFMLLIAVAGVLYLATETITFFCKSGRYYVVK